MVSTVREIVRRGMSINLYMFHGGSSFGFMSGALADPSYRALVPSYGQFLCVMSSITNKLVASWMQTDCERFILNDAELSTDQHYTEHPADGSKRWLIYCITFFSQTMMLPYQKQGTTLQNTISSKICYQDTTVS